MAPSSWRHTLPLLVVGLLLLAPIALLLALAGQEGLSAWDQAELALTSLGLTAAPALLVRTVRQGLWLYVPVLAYALVVLVFLPRLGYWPHEGALNALFATSWRESWEFFQAFGFALAGPAALALICGWCLSQPVYATWLVPWRFKRALLVSLAVAGAASQVGSSWAGLKSPFNVDMLERAYPTLALCDMARDLPRAHPGRAAFRFHAFRRTAVPEREIYVLVMGESSRYANWQVNGYGRPTSPHLAAYGPAALLGFQDVTAVANLTANVWPVALSRATLETRDVADRERSVVSLFGEAGFSTAWLSNQNTTLREAYDADRQTFLNFAWQLTWDAFDTALLPLLDAELARGLNKQFIVLHLMGSHGDYRFRYSRRAAVFGDGSKRGGVYKLADRQRLVDAYDNSIVANDALLDQIVQRVDRTGAIAAVVFLADHGENLLDDDRHLVWHGTDTSSRFETHVPLFILPNARWRKGHPAQLAALQAHRAVPTMQTALFATLANLADIGYPGEDATRSLASMRYQAPAKRLTMLPNQRLVDVNSLR